MKAYSAEFDALLAERKAAAISSGGRHVVGRSTSDDSRHAGALFGGALVCLLAVAASVALWQANWGALGGPSSLNVASTQRTDTTLAIAAPNLPLADIGGRDGALGTAEQATLPTRILNPLQAVVDAAPGPMVRFGILTAALPKPYLKVRVQQQQQEPVSALENSATATVAKPIGFLPSAKAPPSEQPTTNAEIAGGPDSAQPSHPEALTDRRRKTLTDRGTRDRDEPNYNVRLLGPALSDINTASRTASGDPVKSAETPAESSQDSIKATRNVAEVGAAAPTKGNTSSPGKTKPSKSEKKPRGQEPSADKGSNAPSPPGDKVGTAGGTKNNSDVGRSKGKEGKDKPGKGGSVRS